MSVAIIIERRNGAGLIGVDEWRTLVERHEDLRLRTEPYFAMNPSTGASISIPVGDADSEIAPDGEWHPFLRWRRGKLTTEYQMDFELPRNPLRLKLVEVANELAAVLNTDVDEEPLRW